MKIKKRVLSDCILGLLTLLSCYPIRIYRFIWLYTLYIACAWIVIKVIRGKYRPSKIIFILTIFFGINAVFTVLNNNTLLSYTDSVLTLYLRVFLYIIWIDYSVKRDKRLFLDIHFYVLSVLYLWQLYYQIVNPARFGIASSGNYQNLILSDNFLGYIFVPYMVLVCIRAYYQKGKLDLCSFLMLLFCCISVIKSQAGAGMFGVVFFMVAILYCEWFEKRKKNKQVAIWKYYVLYLGFFVAVVFFNMQYLAAGFLENVLNKDITFTGRTAIWAVAIDMIKSNPFWGYGTMPDGRTLVVGISLSSGSSHSAHNYFLSLLIETGIWGLLIYVYMLVIVARQIYHAKDRYIANVIASGIFAMFLMYISEGMITQPAQYMIFILAFYSSEWAYIAQKSS